MSNLRSAPLPLKTGRRRPEPLAAKDLGHIVAVQDRAGLLSLVRIHDGHATCDCAQFTASKLACVHIAAAARLLRRTA